MLTARSRAATLPLVAGLPVLDLVNTISWRGAPDRSEDHLQDAESCLVWAARAGVVTTAEADQLRGHLERALRAAETLPAELRQLRAVVADVVRTPSDVARHQAGTMIASAIGRAELAPVGASTEHAPYEWRVSTLDEHTISRRLALDLHALLTSGSGRVGVCADPDCQWVFLDTSRGHQRRWCDSRDCGNRHRVRLHQQRRREA